MSYFEKRFGKYAIRNISLMLILCYAVGYIIQLINGNFLAYLSLNPYAILHGQVWRLFTWIVIPPESLSPFTLLMLFFYYSIGTSLERTWGTYRYNVYLFSGMLFTIVGSFLWMGLEYLFAGGVIESNYAAYYFGVLSGMFSTYYINMSIFLAYAATFPNMQVLLMMIIPIKVKWLGIVYGVMLAYDFIFSGMAIKIVIGSSLLNFVIFFLTSRNHIHMSPKQMKRRAEFKQDIKRNAPITKHKCAICGQTDQDDENLEFRFCSKCNGNYEYCQNHLFTHTHVQ